MNYAVVTPARDEVANLSRLADSLAGQRVLPERWVIVDNGSVDSTPELAASLAEQHPWIVLLDIGGAAKARRGAPHARAFEAGARSLDPMPSLIVKVDADISLEPDYFERLLARFADEPRLGIASGTCHEQTPAGVWQERHVTGDHVWGAARAYRRECLNDVLPLERHLGWDGIDLLRADLAGWRTTTFRDLPFRHHRPEGERDGSARHARAHQGRGAWFMGYRPSYLAARSLYAAVREPAALAMLWGYAGAAVRREPRCSDAKVRAHLREQQRLSLLTRRLREARGRS